MKRNILRLSILLTLSLLAFARLTQAADHHDAPAAGPDEALKKLKEGNQRYAGTKVTAGKHTAERRAETGQSQHPFAIIIGCADSRTSPEIVFDLNLGDLFVIRTAGNLVDDYALGSIEYAVEHLGSRLVVVMGHERCGAVKAALGGGKVPGHINALVRDIQPAVKASKRKEGDVLANAVQENAAQVAAKIRKLAKFGEFAAQVRVITAYYDLDTGVVEWAKD